MFCLLLLAVNLKKATLLAANLKKVSSGYFFFWCSAHIGVNHFTANVSFEESTIGVTTENFLTLISHNLTLISHKMTVFLKPKQSIK